MAHVTLPGRLASDPYASDAAAAGERSPFRLILRRLRHAFAAPRATPLEDLPLDDHALADIGLTRDEVEIRSGNHPRHFVERAYF